MQRENDAQISALGVMKKAPSQWKTERKKKRSFQLTCKDKIFKMVCKNFFWINGSPDI